MNGQLIDETIPVLNDDPFSLENLRVPEAFDAKLREAGPLVYLERYGIYASGQHAVVEEAFTDYGRFTSSHGTGLKNLAHEHFWRAPTILEMDPPEHTPGRKVMNRVLGAPNIRKFRENFEQTAEQMVDDLVSRGRFDLAKDLAEAFLLAVLPDAAGLPQEGRDRFLAISRMNFQSMGPENELYFESLKDVGGDADAAMAWVFDRVRRELVSDGGFGAQLYGYADEGTIPESQAAIMTGAFIIAGMDTTMYGIGLALQSLAERPEQYKLLHENPELARNAFEESMRFRASSPRIGRTTRDVPETELAGHRIPALQKFLGFVGAAGRDPRRWERPDEFDITRVATGHLAFGAGVHNCVGQMIARLEAECLIKAFARRVREVRIVGTPIEVTSNWLRGYESVPIEVVAA
ncbi:cytochrome P450 [Micromonospora sonchi]|uniref:Cytochrome P450 n=1 Tax=Micromonospora sonchi TaxID=1763543 RepID=A0A917U7U3_9ACTN|nr:cytochrome P450 [Micromonospora sonchi]GGM63951.1 cytochrome P450 [Micromonospora sonchi]